MTTRTSAAIRIWRAGHSRTRADHAYLAYLLAMVAVVLVTPVVRAIAVTLTSAHGIALLTSPGAPGTTMLAVSGLWAAMLLLGRVRGPALRPPFLAHALASSDLSKADGFRGPLLRAGMIVISLVTAVAAAIGTSMVVAGRASPGSATVFGIAGACVGIVAVVAWLMGQVMPRTAAILAPSLFAVGALTTATSAVTSFTPWGWVGLAYPSAVTDTSTLLPAAALAMAAIAAVPTLMNRLVPSGLIAQSTRWEAATSHAAGMELADAVSVYGAAPRAGRRWRAIRPSASRVGVFVLRDAVGAARTPVRLTIGILAVMSAGALLAISLTTAPPNGILGAVAGVILFVAVGPLTDGIRHAASVVADLPLYGISDGSLLAHHALFPLVLSVTVLVAVSIIVALLSGHSALPAALASGVLGILALVSRIGGALKAPLPPALLTPIPTPVGDLSAAARLAWALDGILLTAVAGASAVLTPTSPVPAVVVGIALGGLVFRRWLHRR